MPRMKLSDDEFDEKELDVEYEGPQFERYQGEVPKTGTILSARVTKMWFTTSQDGDSQIKMIVVAEQNDGAHKEFNGLPTWENLTFIPSASRRYQAFLYNFGLTVRDVKRKMMVAAEDDNIGTPIESIAGWEPNSDDALCRVVIKRDNYNNEWQSKLDWDGWLPFDDEEDDVEEDEKEAPPARPRRTPARATATTSSRHRAAEPEPEDDDDEDVQDDEDVDDYDDDDEPEEVAAPPARSRRAAASTSNDGRRSGTAGSRSSARSSGNGRGTSRASGRKTTAAAGRSRRSSGSKDDPPF